MTEMTRQESQEAIGFSCGWRFSDHWAFDHNSLTELIRELSIPRIKGIVKTDDGWLVINKMQKYLSIEPLKTNQVKDEKNQTGLKMISALSADWDEIERLLINCRSLSVGVDIV